MKLAASYASRCAHAAVLALSSRVQNSVQRVHRMQHQACYVTSALGSHRHHSVAQSRFNPKTIPCRGAGAAAGIGRSAG